MDFEIVILQRRIGFGEGFDLGLIQFLRVRVTFKAQPQRRLTIVRISGNEVNPAVVFSEGILKIFHSVKVNFFLIAHGHD